jgi:hypothetical protein
LDVAKGYESHCRKLTALGIATGNEEVFAALETYVMQIGYHRRSVEAILDYSLGTASLVCCYIR